MKVELRIYPGCDGMSVVINAPALTDEVKALAARLEGGGVLVGWQGGRAVPLAAEDILRCYGEEKGVECQTPAGVYDARERLDALEARIRELGMNPEDYWWYLDLRRYGGCRHAGFGLGFERMVMYLTGIGNIRDVLPHPRTVGNADF